MSKRISRTVMGLKQIFFLPSTDMHDATVEHFIRLIEPKLQSYNDLTRNHKILQALLELNVQNDDEFELLSDNYKNLLHNKQNLEERFKSESSNLNRLIGILTDFYIDKNKFKGINVRHKLNSLQDALNNFRNDSDTLMEIFCSTN